MRGKYSASAAMPPDFALPPAIQKMSEKLASARAAASALVALESLTNSTRPLRPTCSMRWARPGNDRRPRSIVSGASPSASAAAVAQAAFWALCRPRSEPMQHRDSRHALAGAFEPLGNFLRPFVVDADDGGAVRRDAFDQPRLDRRVTRDRAVPIEMVRRDIEQDADRGIEARREIDLIGRA